MRPIYAEDAKKLTGTLTWLDVAEIHRTIDDCPTVPTPGTWVPVSERLPEPGKAVLLFCPDGWMWCGFYDPASKGMEWDLDDDARPLSTFSHWMPMPEAPRDPTIDIIDILQEEILT